jgi:ubiquinone/menaquinone biosynthesis C-methylase UbiE
MILNNSLNKLKSFLGKGNVEITRNAKEGYRIWANSYDDEKDNLMLIYDEVILKQLLSNIDLSGKIILDYGCGTGRNWPELQKYYPAKIIGCDISPEMIYKLKNKFNDAETYLITDEKLDFLNDNSCDLIISTLVISHIQNIEKLFAEWSRLLKESGDLIITDFHPDLFGKGGARTFKQEGKSYKIEHHIHEINKIEKLLLSLGFNKINFIEKLIDENVKSYYIRKNAVHIFERFKGTPFIYGLHLKK